MPFYVSGCETTGDNAHLFGSDFLAITILQKLPVVPYLPLWKESIKTTPEKTKHHPKTDIRQATRDQEHGNISSDLKHPMC